MEITEKHGKQLGILDDFGMLGFCESKQILKKQKLWLKNDIIPTALDLQVDFYTHWHTKLVRFTLRSPCVSRSRDHLLGWCGWWCGRGGTADHTHGTPAASQGEGALSWWTRVVILCQWSIGVHADSCLIVYPVYPMTYRSLPTSTVVWKFWPLQMYKLFWMVWQRGFMHLEFGGLCPVARMEVMKTECDF